MANVYLPWGRLVPGLVVCTQCARSAESPLQTKVNGEWQVGGKPKAQHKTGTSKESRFDRPLSAFFAKKIPRGCPSPWQNVQPPPLRRMSAGAAAENQTRLVQDQGRTCATKCSHACFHAKI